MVTDLYLDAKNIRDFENPSRRQKSGLHYSEAALARQESKYRIEARLRTLTKLVNRKTHKSARAA